MEAAEGRRFRSSGGGSRIPTSWTEYFPGEPYSDLDRRVLMFEALTRSLQSPKGQQLLSQVMYTVFLLVSFRNLSHWLAENRIRDLLLGSTALTGSEFF